MAIAFRSVGTRTKKDIAAVGSPQTVSMPAGHVSGDLLLLVVVTDDNTGPGTPSGWARYVAWSAGTSSSVPYTPRPRLTIFGRIDNGSLGSSVSVPFTTTAYPAGDPYAIACILAYSGCDNVTPVGEGWVNSTTATTAALAHTQVTTSSANDWLLTIRASSTDSPAATFTNSVGTDVERVDDNDGFPELAFAVYDSNTALAAGLQTQRTTTASRTCTYGSVYASLAIRPVQVASAAVALPFSAEGTGAAYAPEVQAVSGPWDLCSVGGLPAYSVAVDWTKDGDFSDVNEDVTADIVSETTVTYGRDQERQLSPAAVGSSSFSLINVDRTYSPEYVSSPLYGDLNPACPVRMQTQYLSTTYNLFRGVIDDFDVTADRSNRTVDLTCLDTSSLLQGVDLSTEIYGSLRTGDLINLVLDLASWTGPRDIDLGATVVPYWWEEGTDALSAIDKLVKSEGPPAIAYVSPDGTFIFRDRHHRLLRVESLASQGTFSARRLDCLEDIDFDRYTGATATGQGTAATQDYIVVADSDATDILIGDTVKLFNSSGALKQDTIFTVTGKPSAFGFTNIQYTPNSSVVTVLNDQVRVGIFPTEESGDGSFDYTPSFVYAHGWRDIINSVTFEVEERSKEGSLTDVWTSEDSVTLGIGESADIEVSTSDPFMDAVTPQLTTDYTTSGAGVVGITLSRTSGQSSRITLQAIGGSVTINDLKLRAKALSVRRTRKVILKDTGSITLHGERSYPESAPWANANDAGAIASMILLHYARRRPTVQLRVVTQDPAHFAQVLERTLSDRIHIYNGELGLDSDFFIERVTHTIARMNVQGKPPVHSVIFGCEKDLSISTNPFTFDKRGSGFDDGVFDPITADNPASVFIFDHLTQGQFDVGVLGT